MKRLFAVLLLWALVAVACGSSEPAAPTSMGPIRTTTTAPATTIATPTTSVATTSTSTTTTIPETTTTTFAPGLIDVDACRLPDVLRDDLNLGFRTTGDRIAPLGSVRAKVLFVDFPDAVAELGTQELFARYSPATELFYAAVSYGQMDLELDPHLEWLHYKTSSIDWSYGWTHEGLRDAMQAIADLADDAVDFEDTDLVVIIPNPAAPGLGTARAFIGWSDPNGDGGSALRVDGETITNAVTMGTNQDGRRADLFGSPEAAILAHEIGHTLGFPDTYGDIFWHREISIMADWGNIAPAFYAYEAWLVGWLDDDQVLCLDSTDFTATLSPIELAGGPKVVIIRLDETRDLVIESRRAVGADEDFARSSLGNRPGVAAYTVDSSVASYQFQGPIRNVNDGFTLLEGESVTFEGITVIVQESTDEGDTVLVTFDG